jgi:hypothetical protein
MRKIWVPMELVCVSWCHSAWEDESYLCLFSVDLVNFMNLRGRPGPPTSWRPNNARAARMRMMELPAVTTWRANIPWTVLVVLVMAIA